MDTPVTQGQKLLHSGHWQILPCVCLHLAGSLDPLLYILYNGKHVCLSSVNCYSKLLKQGKGLWELLICTTTYRDLLPVIGI